MPSPSLRELAAEGIDAVISDTRVGGPLEESIARLREKHASIVAGKQETGLGMAAQYVVESGRRLVEKEGADTELIGALVLTELQKVLGVSEGSDRSYIESWIKKITSAISRD